MLIRVMYDDGRYDMVKPFQLDTLLEDSKVISFKRHDGWVVVGNDPIRNPQRPHSYTGPERRMQ